MIDIVERLRQVGAFGPDGNFYEAAADEIERLRECAALEPLQRGFMTACSGDGEYQIKISFETLAEMQAAHKALVALSQADENRSRT